jgi:hypothetical protein
VKVVLERLGKIDSLLLACTHYPELELLDPAACMVDGLPRGGSGSIHFFTTGSGEVSKRAARGGFSVELSVAHELTSDLQSK